MLAHRNGSKPLARGVAVGGDIYGGPLMTGMRGAGIEGGLGAMSQVGV